MAKKKKLILSSAIAVAGLALARNIKSQNKHVKAKSYIIKLPNRYKVKISFVDETTVHLVYFKNKSHNYPTIMKNERVLTGGDPTVATGKLSNDKIPEFVVNKTKIEFNILENRKFYHVFTDKMSLMVEKKTGEIVFYRDDQPLPVIIQKMPIFNNGKIVSNIRVNQKKAKYYGGGMQNGCYDHTGKVLKIENLNDWLDRGVSSPTPFIWSSAGFGILNHTYTKGEYDFQNPKEISFCFEDEQSDNYYFLGQNSNELIKSYFNLTGYPMIMPKFAWYPAHLNAYNRDTWVEVTEDSSGARKFEDGKFYKEYQPLNPKSFNLNRPDKIEINGKDFVPAIRGIGEVTFVKDKFGNLNTYLESLNGEKNNYQFSARQIIDRYESNDIPLGWFLPNDGYGAGYGQTDSLDQNIDNLKKFSEYAGEKGVKIGLWTQENLHPQDPENPKANERDLKKEVESAHIAAIKTDVAWVGHGYQAGVGALKDIAYYMKKYGKNERPFSLTLDGWAGIQKYAAIWTGDQPGGTWENIGYQIPTYLSSALSGLSNVGSDIDGIYKGSKPVIQTRDLQWKSFTPIQLNMDGWGSENKTPFTFNGKYTDINRFYLKLKSKLLPYFYTSAYENYLNGTPILRPVTYESIQLAKYPDLTHEFLVGNDILVAPIFEDTKMDVNGDDIRNGIYLPGDKETWIDFFSGEEYQGNQVLNNFDAPLWKTPVFIRKGAIIPTNNPNNNPSEIDQSIQKFVIYPSSANNQITVYDDDGFSDAYLNGEYVSTKVFCQKNDQEISITVDPTVGSFQGFNPVKKTILNLKIDRKPDQVMVNGQDWKDFHYENDLERETNLSNLPKIKNGDWLIVKVSKHDVRSDKIKITIKM